MVEVVAPCAEREVGCGEGDCGVTCSTKMAPAGDVEDSELPEPSHQYLQRGTTEVGNVLFGIG